MTTSESHLQFRSQDDMGRHKYHKIKDDTYCELICCHVLPLTNHHASPNLFTCIHVTNPLSIVSFTAKLNPSTTSSTHLFVWLHTPHKAHLKEILLPVRITTIRLMSFGQWSQLSELGIIWFCTSQSTRFEEVFKLEICALYLILLSSEFGWMKNSCKSHLYTITIAICFYVLSFVINFCMRLVQSY